MNKDALSALALGTARDRDGNKPRREEVMGLDGVEMDVEPELEAAGKKDKDCTTSLNGDGNGDGDAAGEREREHERVEGGIDIGEVT